jgi:hypothetical protein
MTSTRADAEKPPAVVVTVASPAPTAVTTPAFVTVTTAEFDDVHGNGPVGTSTTAPVPSTRAAVNNPESPGRSANAFGVTERPTASDRVWPVDAGDPFVLSVVPTSRGAEMSRPHASVPAIQATTDVLAIHRPIDCIVPPEVRLKRV